MPSYTVGSDKAYATITLALAAVPADLAGTGIHEISIDAGTYPETVTVSKTNPSGSDYIVLKAASGSEHRFSLTSGVIIDGTGDTTNAPLRIATRYTRTENIIAKTNAGTNYGAAVRIDSSDARFTNVIGICPSAAISTTTGFQLNSVSDCEFRCCLALDAGLNKSGAWGFVVSGGSSNKFYNCGVRGFSTGFGTGGFTSTNIAKNCWVILINGNFGDFGTGFSSALSSNNATNDTTPFGSNGIPNLTVAQAGFISDLTNFHILSTSVLFNAGINLSDVFTQDVDLQTITDWSIGPDAQTRASSVVVDSQPYAVRQWPTPIIRPAIQWIQDSAGNWNGSDRGAAQDIYETEVVFFDTQGNIDTLMEALDDNREGITLSNFAVPFFSPEVDHTGSISATVVSFGPRRHLAWGAASKWVYELPVTFRAISPTLLGTSASLSTLKLQDGFEASASYEVGKAFTYGQTAVYADRRSDIGRFVGRFRQQTSQAQAILAYLLTTARANAVAFPSLGGVTYPWGVNRGAPTNCKVKSFSIRRVNLVFWDLEIEFVESV